MSVRKSVCLITGGYTGKNLPLQPWRYLSEVAKQLAKQQFKVTVITDGAERHTVETVDGIMVRRLPSINRYRWQSNQTLQAAIELSNPSVILWHLGLPSFLHQRIHGWQNVPVVGIFPGLIYKPAELLRLGLGRIVKGYKLSAIHMAGMLVPKQSVRHALAEGGLAGLVAQTESTSQRLLQCGLHPEQVKVILPGVDDIWAQMNANGQDSTRQGLGYTPQDTVVLYFGSPAPLRGLHTLIRAVELARQTDPSIKLLVLNRRRRDELVQEDADLRRLLENDAIGPHVQVISGYLPPDELAGLVMATDIVSLPFELVPADAPLSILEAQALGKPIVTTRVASLPEMVATGASYLAEPANPDSLAQTLLEAAADLDRSPHAQDSSTRRGAIRSWRKVGEEWSQLLQTL